MRKISFIAISLFLFAAIPFISSASTLFFMPQSAEYQKSDTFIKILHVDTVDQEINAIGSKINFNRDILEVTDIITGDSIIKLWMEEPIVSNEKGNIEFVGGIPGGYKGEGVILKIIFKAKKTGNFILNLSDTKILLNNGRATEDEIGFLDNNYTVVEKSDDFIKIISNSHPDQDKWKNDNTLDLHWDLADRTQYSYILSKDPLAEPDEIPDKPEGKLAWMGDMNYKQLEDNIYYFHLKQKLPDEDWSPRITVRVMIDATNPEDFTPQIIDIDGIKYLVFSTTDAASGIDRYEVSEIGLDWLGNIKSEQETEWKTVKSPYLLEDQSLKNAIRIKAVDKAGNERLSEAILSSGPKFFTEQIVFLALVLIIIAITSSIAWKLFLRKNKNKK